MANKEVEKFTKEVLKQGQKVSDAVLNLQVLDGNTGDRVPRTKQVELQLALGCLQEAQEHLRKVLGITQPVPR